MLFTLPSTRTPIGLEPPLTGAVSFEHDVSPVLFRQRVDTREHVRVGVDAHGKPTSVSVVQRLLISGKGDYVYTVPAPVLGVVATADSQSQPGFRTGAILWAGFSPGRRRLGARARLELRHAAPYLPLRVKVESTPRVVRLTLRNATRATTPIAVTTGDAVKLARMLDAARRGRFPTAGAAISVRTPVRTRAAAVEAPLVVTGTITQRTGLRRTFTVELGDGRPLTRTLTFHASATDTRPPVVQLKVDTVLPRRTLTPPGGAQSWLDYARRGSDSTKLLVAAEYAFLRAARAYQYDTYLKNPTLAGGNSVADFTYVTAAPRVVARAGGSHGLGTLAIVLIAAGSVVAAGALVVWWAHS